MNTTLKRLSPFLLIIIGLFMLLIMGNVMIAGVCLLLGIVMVIERIWPEEWGAERKKSQEQL